MGQLFSSSKQNVGVRQEQEAAAPLFTAEDEEQEEQEEQASHHAGSPKKEAQVTTRSAAIDIHAQIVIRSQARSTLMQKYSAIPVGSVASLPSPVWSGSLLSLLYRERTMSIGFDQPNSMPAGSSLSTSSDCSIERISSCSSSAQAPAVTRRAAGNSSNQPLVCPSREIGQSVRQGRTSEEFAHADVRFKALERRIGKSEETDRAVDPRLVEEEVHLLQECSDLLPFGTVSTTKVGLVICGGNAGSLESALRSFGIAPDPDGDDAFNIKTVTSAPILAAALPLVARGRRVIFVVVISLRDSRQQRLVQLQHWLRLVRALALTDTKPIVHIVLTHCDCEQQDASHADVLASTSAWAQKAVIEQVQAEFSECLDVGQQSLYMLGDPTHCLPDTGNDPELLRLCQALHESRDRLLSNAGDSLWVVEEAAVQLKTLRMAHSKWPIVSEAEFWRQLHLEKYTGTLSLEGIRTAILRQLQAEDEVVWLPQAQLVVINTTFLLAGVLQKLSPENIIPGPDADQKSEKFSGHVPLCRLENIFGRRNTPHVVAIIRELDLGFAWTNDSTLLLPAAVTRGPEAKRWRPLKDDAVLGRRLLLSQPTDYFDELFVFKLQVRLCGFFSSEPFLWKGGLVGEKDNVICHVMTTFDGQGIDVWALADQSESQQVRDVVLDVLDIVHRLHIKERINLQPKVYALSQILLRGYSFNFDFPEDVLGCLVDDLEKMKLTDDRGQPAMVQPVHPMHVPQRKESVANMLGLQAAPVVPLWPLNVLGIETGVVRILFVRANIIAATHRPLDSDAEERDIRAVIRHSPSRNSIRTCSIGAATPNCIQRAVHMFKPHVIHFMGHSGPKGLVCYANKSTSNCAAKETVQVSGEELCALLKNLYHKSPLPLLVINGCEAGQMVDHLLSVAMCVVCPTTPLVDALAIPFSTTFYRSLFGGEDIEDTFDSATGEIQRLLTAPTASQQGFKDPQYICKMRKADA